MGRYLGLLSDESFYQESPSWASIEMRNGTLFNEIDVARVAFPIVWSSSNSNLRKQQHGEEILSKLWDIYYFQRYKKKLKLQQQQQQY